MIRYRLMHPDILRALGTAGHGSQILIADGNYPFGTGAHPAAARVWLNLAPGLLTVPDVLAVLVDAVPIEAAQVMMPDAGPEPTIFDAFRGLLPGLTLGALGRFPFYAAARGSDCRRNVAALYQHLEGQGPPAQPRDLAVWDALLGPLAAATDQWVEAMGEHGVQHVPAALLADQVKAFEMIGLGWLAAVLLG